MDDSETSMDRQRREDREEYIPIGRAGNMVINRIGRRRGLRSPAPTNQARTCWHLLWEENGDLPLPPM